MNVHTKRTDPLSAQRADRELSLMLSPATEQTTPEHLPVLRETRIALETAERVLKEEEEEEEEVICVCVELVLLSARVDCRSSAGFLQTYELMFPSYILMYSI